MMHFEPVGKPDGQAHTRLVIGERDGTAGIIPTPFIPDIVYAQLPPVLSRACSVFSEGRERDVFLTGCITVLSGCAISMTGEYDRVNVWSNLNCCVVAPPSSGKGAFRWVRKMLEDYHEHRRESTRQAETEFEIALGEYQRAEKQGTAPGPKPKPPPQQLVFIPANSSAASLVDSLAENGGWGIICETEVDSLLMTLGQDWGNYSDIIRKSFHHESVSYKRKTLREFVEIPSPRLSVVLAGTPERVRKLIPSSEDGLFSRFLYYVFEEVVEPPHWRDMSPSPHKIPLDAHFSRLSKEISLLIQSLGQKGNVSFDYTAPQWNIFNQAFKRWQTEAYYFNSPESISLIRRLGLSTFRISMLLSFIRFQDKDSYAKGLRCTDMDFHSALELAAVYKDHGLFMLNSLPKQDTKPLDLLLKQFFIRLPPSFTRQEAAVIASDLAIEERTLTNYLSKFISCELLEKIRHGVYKKTI